ncbi:hypothetical protein [Planktothrix tepida]|nr:hypothetical protein [Planktothrix tepida]
MLTRQMQRFSPQSIYQLQQIGLAFFEKIATDSNLAGETQDFYQGLLVGLDWGVKLIDQEQGIETLKDLEARVATFINLDNPPSQQPNPSTAIHRLSSASIAQLQQKGRSTDLDENVLACVPATETQDFYHGCLAALDISISLSKEKYAYAQISLLKTNAAHFIELSSQSDRQVARPTLQDLSLSQSRKPRRFSSLLPVYQSGVATPVSPETNSEALIESGINDSDYAEDSEQVRLEDDPQDSKEGEGLIEVGSSPEQRLELERLLADLLLKEHHQFKGLERLEFMEDWTILSQQGESIRVVSQVDHHLVFKINLEGEVQNPLSNLDAEKLKIKLTQEAPELLSEVQVLGNNSNSTIEPLMFTLEREQVKQAELILPIAQKVFEYKLNLGDEGVEETDDLTIISVAEVYQLIVTNVEGVSVSSLRASGRGELLRVRGEHLVLAQGIRFEDVEFWRQMADDLNTVESQPAQHSREIEL